MYIETNNGSDDLAGGFQATSAFNGGHSKHSKSSNWSSIFNHWKRKGKSSKSDRDHEQHHLVPAKAVMMIGSVSLRDPHHHPSVHQNHLMAPHYIPNSAARISKFSSVSAATGAGINSPYGYPPATLSYRYPAVSMGQPLAMHSSIRPPTRHYRQTIMNNLWDQHDLVNLQNTAVDCTCSDEATSKWTCSSNPSAGELSVENSVHKSGRPCNLDSSGLNRGQKSKRSGDSVRSGRSIRSSLADTYEERTFTRSKSEVSLEASRKVSFSTVNERFLRAVHRTSKKRSASIVSRRSILECDLTAYDLVEQNVRHHDGGYEAIQDNLMIANNIYSEKENQTTLNSRVRKVDDYPDGHRLNGEHGITADNGDIVAINKASTRILPRIDQSSLRCRQSVSRNPRYGGQITSGTDSLSKGLRIAGQGVHLRPPVKCRSSDSILDITCKHDHNLNCNLRQCSSQQPLALPEPDYDGHDDDSRSLSSSDSDSDHHPFDVLSNEDEDENDIDCDVDDRARYKVRNAVDGQRNPRSSARIGLSSSYGRLSSSEPERLVKRDDEPKIDLNYICKVKSILKKTVVHTESWRKYPTSSRDANQPFNGGADCGGGIEGQRGRLNGKVDGLRSNGVRGQRKKHVRFGSSLGDDLLIEHINETIVEEEEPIYDDIANIINNHTDVISRIRGSFNSPQSSDDSDARQSYLRSSSETIGQQHDRCNVTNDESIKRAENVTDIFPSSDHNSSLSSTSYTNQLTPSRDDHRSYGVLASVPGDDKGTHDSKSWDNRKSNGCCNGYKEEELIPSEHGERRQDKCSSINGVAPTLASGSPSSTHHHNTSSATSSGPITSNKCDNHSKQSKDSNGIKHDWCESSASEKHQHLMNEMKNSCKNFAAEKGCDEEENTANQSSDEDDQETYHPHPSSVNEEDNQEETGKNSAYSFTVSIVNKVNGRQASSVVNGSSKGRSFSYSSSSSSSSCSYYDARSGTGNNHQLNKIVIDVPMAEDYYNGDTNEHIYEELDKVINFDDTNQNSLDSSTSISVAASPEDSGDVDQGGKSIFEGASKDEILEYLEDAKERVEVLISNSEDNSNKRANDKPNGVNNRRIRTSNISNVSNSSTDSGNTATTSSSIDTTLSTGGEEEDSSLGNSVCGHLVERNDSGVGMDSGKPCKVRRSSESYHHYYHHNHHRNSATSSPNDGQCADCEEPIDSNHCTRQDFSGNASFLSPVCADCDKKRCERKEIISEFVDTEFKYGRDLRIIREEFYRPMEVAGLLSKEQITGVFINLDELISVNSRFSEKLQDAIDIATEQGDEDYTTVNIGKLFVESSSMLHSFETYCIRQGSASLLLGQLEKERELLRIFLKVSQMENTLLRRMNLSAFLMVPVQRVTKYPLLLDRLYKVTPTNHKDREALRMAWQKVGIHLEHINQKTKGSTAPAKIWRKFSHLSNKRLPNQPLEGCLDEGCDSRIQKSALKAVNWSEEQSNFILSGRLMFSPVYEYQINKKKFNSKFIVAYAVLMCLGEPLMTLKKNSCKFSSRNGLHDNEEEGENAHDDGNEMDRARMFPLHGHNCEQAVLILLKEKCGRYSLIREPLNLASCVVSLDKEFDEQVFEVNEINSKETIVFKASNRSENRKWFEQVSYYARNLGNWRKRRNALANLMVVRS